MFFLVADKHVYIGIFALPLISMVVIFIHVQIFLHLSAANYP